MNLLLIVLETRRLYSVKSIDLLQHKLKRYHILIDQ